MNECPHCERHKQRVELWRQEAYRLSERQWVGLTDEELGEFDLDPIEAKLMIDKLKEKNMKEQV